MSFLSDLRRPHMKHLTAGGVYVCVKERERMCVCVRERERECVCERVSLSVCV